MTGGAEIARVDNLAFLQYIIFHDRSLLRCSLLFLRADLFTSAISVAPVALQELGYAAK